MVFTSNILGYVLKKAPRKYRRSGFMDTLRLFVKAGNGGMGLPRYGGLGGRGGHVYVEATNKMSLEMVTAKAKIHDFHADNGLPSTRNYLIGEPGKDLFIKAPVGISIYTEDGLLLGDLNEENSKLKVASGGIGGCPETGFSGQKGESHHIRLDLKLIANAGLVGFPNAGKSSLLRSISRAKPKVAAYPFTTIKPHLGTIQYKDLRLITMADLPGLIEGAHANVGMGHSFLKHLTRTKVLVFMVDVQGFQLSVMHPKRNCLETIILLNKEVELYKPDLLRLPAVLIVNKMDTENATEIFKNFEPSLQDLSSVLDNFPEEMRPEKALKFESIITTSILKNKTKDIAKIKCVVRDVLDKFYIQENEEELEKKEEQFVEKLKRELRQEVPTLL